MIDQIERFEILGQDTHKLRGFYGELFGWKFEQAPGESADYAMIDREQSGIGGAVGEAVDRSGWVTVYVRVVDLRSAIARAERLGGKVILPITELPQLSYAVVSDPEGHPIGLLARPLT